MTDTPPGPGWWKASDGNWYPPDQHPDPSHRAQYAQTVVEPPAGGGGTTPPPVAPAAGELPSYVVSTPYECENWRPLVNWILTIPHLVIAGVLRYAISVVGIIVWFAVLFTGRIPPGLYRFLAMHLRYETRANAYLLGFTSTYPPFDFPTRASDDGGHPGITVQLPEPPTETPRSALLNFLLAIPHYIVFAIIGIGAGIVAIIGWFAVLFTGRWPQGMRDFLVRVANYWLRIWVYIVMVDTRYPRFGLK